MYTLLHFSEELGRRGRILSILRRVRTLGLASALKWSADTYRIASPSPPSSKRLGEWHRAVGYFVIRHTLLWTSIICHTLLCLLLFARHYTDIFIICPIPPFTDLLTYFLQNALCNTLTVPCMLWMLSLPASGKTTVGFSNLLRAGCCGRSPLTSGRSRSSMCKGADLVRCGAAMYDEAPMLVADRWYGWLLVLSHNWCIVCAMAAELRQRQRWCRRVNCLD
jgi:hypothetical protein